MEELSQLTEDMISFMLAINESIPIDDEDQVLIVMSLMNKEDEIIKFVKWCMSKRIAPNKLNTTAARIVSAAVRIGRGEEPLD